MLSSSKIGAKAALILKDTGHVTWTVADLAKWINLACLDLVLLKPTALTASVAILLASGTKQSLTGAAFKNTADGTAAALTALQLLEPVRNMGVDGQTPGRAITTAERTVLDTMLPGWHAGAPASEIRHLIPKPKDPQGFFVYPPATAAPAVYAEVLVARAPVNTLSDSATVLADDDIDAGLDDTYESALVDGVLHRAFSGDSETADPQRAQWHYRQFAAALGVKVQTEKIYAPRRRDEGEA
jgi:hypothetical protein